ncbi:hypothetical protein ACHAXR_000835 [Thalassiosira sp. AJA248-18]
MWAYKNEVLRRPLRRLAWALLVLTMLVLEYTYVIKNRKRIENGSRGDGSMDLNGGLKCAKEDIVIVRKRAYVAAMAARAAIISGVEKGKTQLKKKKKKEKKKKKRSKRRGGRDNEDNGGEVEEEVVSNGVMA